MSWISRLSLESGDRNLLQTILKEKIIDSCNLEVHGLSPGLSDVVPCLSPPPPQCLLGAAGLVCSLPLEDVTGSGRNPNGNRAALHFQGRILIGFPWTNHCHWGMKKQVWLSLAVSPSLQQVCVRCTVPNVCSRTSSKGVGCGSPKEMSWAAHEYLTWPVQDVVQKPQVTSLGSL